MYFVMKINNKTKAFLNIATDSSTILGTGTAILGTALGSTASIFNWGCVGLAALTRIGTELVRNRYGNKLPRPVKNYLSNRGAALETRGAAYLISTGISPLENDLHNAAIQSKTSILTLFGGGQFFRGRALSYEQNTPEQKARDGFGRISITTACMIMAEKEPLPVLGGMATSGAISLVETFSKSAADKIAKYQTPDLIIGLTFAGFAATSDDPVLKATNACYAFGYLVSLPLTRVFGSVADAMETGLNKMIPHAKQGGKRPAPEQK